MVKNMYNNRFICAVMINGKPLSELPNGVVEVPYGAQYTLRFKNKHSRRAVVKFTIDGEDASGGGYVIPANGSIDIERFSNVAEKFKFVPVNSDESILDGKNHVPDHTSGVINVQFFLEKEQVYQPLPQIPLPTKPYDSWPYNEPWKKRKKINDYEPYSPPWLYHQTWCMSCEDDQTQYRAFNMCREARIGGPTSEMKARAHSFNDAPTSLCAFQADALYSPAPQEDCGPNGVTVGGDYSSQKFTTTYIDCDWSNPTSVRLILKAKGTSEVYDETQRIKQQIADLQSKLNSLSI